MTPEQYNMLVTIEPILNNWTKSKFFSAVRGPDKDRIVWLCAEFGLPPIDFGCSGCIKARLNSLANIYEKAKQNGTTTRI